jgi:hypothetical protein
MFSWRGAYSIKHRDNFTFFAFLHRASDLEGFCGTGKGQKKKDVRFGT